MVQAPERRQRSVIVYSLPGVTDRRFFVVNEATLSRVAVAKRLSREAALSDIAATMLPEGATDSVITTEDQLANHPPNQAARLLAEKVVQGMPIVSARFPAATGTYSIDDATQQEIKDLADYASKNAGTFPNGSDVFQYLDASGTGVLSWDLEACNDIVRLGGAYIWALRAKAAGQIEDWPTTPVVIP